MSLYITGIRLTNWLCYRGEHEVALGPGIFAIVAERDGDPRRSNAQGKSALLWAIRFALTGDHPKRTEDEWITLAEREGGVDLELSDGTFISRWRRRDSATRLKVVLEPDTVRRMGDFGVEVVQTSRELAGDQAQIAIDRIVGFSKEEQESTWWCGQGKTDAFINGEASDATAAIIRWCGVMPVRKACKRVADGLRALLLEDAKLAAVYADAHAYLLRALGVAAGAESSIDEQDLHEELRAELERAERRVVLLEQSFAKDATLRERERERARLEGLAREYDETEKGKLDIERRMQATPAVDAAALAEARETQGKLRVVAARAKDEVTQKRSLARGQFDGKCPVGGIDCPAKERLNADAASARELLAKVEPLMVDADKALAEADVAMRELEERSEDRRELEEDLQYATRRLADLKPERDAFTALGQAAPERAATAERELREAREARDSLKRRVTDADAARARMTENTVTRDRLAPDILARREALVILGPSGAQRRLADAFLVKVERAANEDLSRAGVDLTVRFHWQRELDDLADACDQCGQPFPSSRKVKICEACFAPRGRKLEQKFRCEVSPKSGGMDALAGVGTRFSSTAWVKARRGSSWSVACLDEPLSAVDEHNRALVGRHLVQMLGAHYGIEQAFVTAHSAALLDSLPRRILVKGSERGSSLEVVG